MYIVIVFQNTYLVIFFYSKFPRSRILNGIPMSNKVMAFNIYIIKEIEEII